jgi:hypothetical protein
LIQRPKRQIGTSKKYRRYEGKPEQSGHGRGRGNLRIRNSDMSLVRPGIVPYSRSVRNRRSPRNNVAVNAMTLPTTHREVL